VDGTEGKARIRFAMLGG
jgi:putative transposase